MLLRRNQDEGSNFLHPFILPRTGIGTHAEVRFMYELYRPARSGLLIILSSVSLVTCTMHKLLNRAPTKTQGAPTLAPISARDHQNSCSKK